MVTVVADMLHLASMSVWLGGLVMRVAFLLARANGTELGAIVPVWSRWATYAVGALVLTGVAQALIEVGSLDALVSTTYGWLVIAKVGLVGGLVGVAYLSCRIVAPITNQEDGGGRPAHVVIIEAVVAAVVLGVASVLVQTTPARTAVTQTEAPAIQTRSCRTGSSP